MALPGTFWTLGGMYTEWRDNWATMNVGTAPNYKANPFANIQMSFSGATYFQLPDVPGVNDTSKGRVHDANLDSGYFYARHASTGALKFPLLFAALGESAGTLPANQCHYEPLVPTEQPGDMEPDYGLGGSDEAKFVTGFFNASLGTSGTLRGCVLYFRGGPTIGSNWKVWHYGPYAWSGVPAAVIADIAMLAGVDADDFDQSSFDDAYDAQILSTGDEPWASYHGTEQFRIWVVRRVGARVIDTLMEAVRHTRDFLFINEEGDLAVASFTDPSQHTDTMDGSSGVVELESDWTSDYIINSVYASMGSATKQWGDPDSQPDGSPTGRAPGAVEEEMLSSIREEGEISGITYIAEASDSASVTKHGARWLPGRKFLADTRGTPREVVRAHFPYILKGGGATNGLIPTATYWLASDAKDRRVLEFKQDFRGVDFGLGEQLTDVNLTSDGEQITDARCIEKEYDFDNWTVRSMLLEVPSNT